MHRSAEEEADVPEWRRKRQTCLGSREGGRCTWAVEEKVDMPSSGVGVRHASWKRRRHMRLSGRGGGGCVWAVEEEADTPGR